MTTEEKTSLSSSISSVATTITNNDDNNNNVGNNDDELTTSSRKEYMTCPFERKNVSRTCADHDMCRENFGQHSTCMASSHSFERGTRYCAHVEYCREDDDCINYSWKSTCIKNGEFANSCSPESLKKDQNCTWHLSCESGSCVEGKCK